MTENFIINLTKEKFIEFKKERIRNVIPSVVDRLDFKNTLPGLIIIKDLADELFKLTSECELCLHIATEPLNAKNVFKITAEIVFNY